MNEFADAGAAPGGDDEDFEIFELGGVGGFESVEAGFGEIFEDVGVFGFNDVGVAVEAVAEGVEAGFELAFAGLGAGALAGIAAVGGDLLVRVKVTTPSGK